MDQRTLELLEFDQIKAALAQYTQSGLGKRLVERMQPLTNKRAIEHLLQETSEARRLLDAGCHVPLGGITDLTEELDKVERGGVLQPQELLPIADLLRSARRLRRYMSERKDLAPLLVAYSQSLTELDDTEQLIEGCLEGNLVSNNASRKLHKVRQQIRITEDRIQTKLQAMLSSPTLQACLQDSFVSVRDGRFVIPVKASHRHQVDGIVIQSSGSGSTVFIEPTAVRKLVNELQLLRSTEEAEVYQVLAMLSGEVGAQLPAIKLNLETMAAFDFALAKGRYSRALQATCPALNTHRHIQLLSARHPLLGRQAIPLQFAIGAGYRTLLITGPNTGGKTVTLKTVGLLTAMAQAGLHIPAEAGSEIAIFQEILADIGDDQSLEQSLSTFSSHMGRIAGILQRVSPACLILLDEIGTGTDPREGAALGAAILEQLHQAGAVTVVTTHYGALKTYAAQRPGWQNARMDFDQETLRPLYHLIIGESGASQGLWIAERLGVGEQVIKRARRLLGNESEQESLSGGLRPPDQESAELEISAAPRPPQRAAPGANLSIGDRVMVHSLGKSGIVASLPDRQGMMTVIVQRQPMRVNHKRVTLQLEKEELYPDHENYDLNIVLISKEDRKLVKRMAKRHVPGAVRTIKPGQQ
ncbi:MAG: endonuclease MutS2 [Bacillota bacterium]|jgi:DNA mismatch repair protein MutS2